MFPTASSRLVPEDTGLVRLSPGTLGCPRQSDSHSGTGAYVVLTADISRMRNQETGSHDARRRLSYGEIRHCCLVVAVGQIDSNRACVDVPRLRDRTTFGAPDPGLGGVVAAEELFEYIYAIDHGGFMHPSACLHWVVA